MDFVGFKREKKRKRRRRHVNKKHRNQMNFEITSSKSNESISELTMKKKNIFAIEASAFWENYKAAHEWQNKHKSTWWKARCSALEHENYLLKETIKELVQSKKSDENIASHQRNQETHLQSIGFKTIDNLDEKNDIFEFQLDEDMMTFLEQSICHKIELKKTNTKILSKTKDTNYQLTNAIALTHRRNEGAKLLYGKATPRILAMETALLTSIAKHSEKLKPQYWPNIPLKF